VIVHDFNVFRAGRRPTEAHAELIVHAKTMLAGPVALQGLQPVAWRDTKVFKPTRDLQLPQLASRDGLDVHKPFDAPTV
jgi:hypothetical protein